MNEFLRHGLRLHGSGRLAEAEHVYRAVAAIVPDDATALHLLGAVLLQQGRPAEAAPALRTALVLSPDSTAILNNLGVTSHELGRPAVAAEWLRRALRRDPADASAHYNLAGALKDMDEPEAARHHCRLALALAPADNRAWFGLGSCLNQLASVQEATAAFERAVILVPDDAAAHWDLALMRLRMGDFPAGWDAYEWRWRKVPQAVRHADIPLWNGDALAGRCLLLHAEQGMGDVLQFVRYVPLVQALGGRVVIEAHPPLVPLLRRLDGVSVVATGAALPPVDLQLPIMSLPRVFATTLETIPASVPYLAADPDRAAVWARRLAGEGLRVGFVWAGNVRNPNDRRRSTVVATLAPLMALPGVRAYSLQVGPRAAELSPELPITDLAPEIRDFDDTAAILNQLDLCISVDTAVAHLAGALARPVWVLLPYASEWRWLTGRDDSPWYPSMRLFRQPRPGDWCGLIVAVADVLSDLARSTNPATCRAG